MHGSFIAPLPPLRGPPPPLWEATEKVFLFYISNKENTIYRAAAFAKQQHIDRKNFFHSKFCTFSVTSAVAGEAGVHTFRPLAGMWF